MTIGSIVSIIFGGIILVVGVATAIYLFCGEEAGAGITCLIATLIIAALFIAIPFVYMNTAEGKRALKDQESNFGNGIERVVEVYDVSGELIKQYEGRFDVEVSNNDGAPYIVFDDEKNKRHIIYYTTGTITIDEK